MMSFPVWWCSCVSCSIHKNTQNNTWKSHCSVPPLFLSLPLSVSLLSFTLVSSSLPPSSLHLWLAFTLLFLHSHLRSPHMLFLSFSHSYSIYPFPLSCSPPPFSLSLSHSLWCPPLPLLLCRCTLPGLAWYPWKQLHNPLSFREGCSAACSPCLLSLPVSPFFPT